MFHQKLEKNRVRTIEKSKDTQKRTLELFCFLALPHNQKMSSLQSAFTAIEACLELSPSEKRSIKAAASKNPGIAEGIVLEAQTINNPELLFVDFLREFLPPEQRQSFVTADPNASCVIDCFDSISNGALIQIGQDECAVVTTAHGVITTRREENGDVLQELHGDLTITTHSGIELEWVGILVPKEYCKEQDMSRNDLILIMVKSINNVKPLNWSIKHLFKTQLFNVAIHMGTEYLLEGRACWEDENFILLDSPRALAGTSGLGLLDRSGDFVAFVQGTRMHGGGDMMVHLPDRMTMQELGITFVKTLCVTAKQPRYSQCIKVSIYSFFVELIVCSIYDLFCLMFCAGLCGGSAV